MTKADDLATREQLRLVFAAMFMHAEISAARGLRRADSLLQQHEESASNRSARP